MMAVKAVYEDGKVEWLQPLGLRGRHEMIVTFVDVEEPAASQGKAAIPDHAMPLQLVPLPELTGRIPDGWKDAIYG